MAEHEPTASAPLPEGQINVNDDEEFYDLTNYGLQLDRKTHLPRDFVSLFYSFGFEGAKRSNVHFLTESILVSAVGNVLQLTNIKSLSQEYVLTGRNGSIGALAVHPTRKFLAVAEKGDDPNILIFDYPALRLYRILRKGTVRAYADVCFNVSGTKLASVGSDPDFMLTIWDWKREQIILRSKAFSQEIFKVSFSPQNDGLLTTSGMGHIKFWKMAQTFTGLKLQGYNGKFGAVELSDITGFIELPDGKVLAGAESGNLLLWEGGFIKCEIMSKNHRPCHAGMIRVCLLHEGELFTAGDDGYVRVWDFETIENADIAMTNKIFEMEPLDEILVGKDVKIVGMIQCLEDPSEYLCQDENGYLWHLHPKKRVAEKILSFHAGAIAGIDVAPNEHKAITLGTDGTLRVFDYVNKLCLRLAKYSSPGSFIAFVPEKVDPAEHLIITGFADGVIRIIQSANEALTLQGSYKPHTKPVTQALFSESGAYLATAAQDNTLFLFAVEKTLIPLGFVNLPSAASSLSWTYDGVDILYVVCSQSAELLTFEMPSRASIQNSTSFELNISSKPVSIDWVLPKWNVPPPKPVTAETTAKKPEDGSEETVNSEGSKESEVKPVIVEERVPVTAKAAAVHFLMEGSFLLGINLSNGYSEVYECSHGNQSIPRLVATLPHNISLMRVSLSEKYLLLGGVEGGIFVQPYYTASEVDPSVEMTPIWEAHVHDCDKGRIRGLMTSFDDSHLLSVGNDGNFFAFRIKSEGIRGEQIKDTAKEGSFRIVEKSVEDSYLDPSAHSLQEAKLKSKRDQEIELAEKNKQATRAFIAELRNEYLAIVSENNRAPLEDQLDRDTFDIDPGLKERIENETLERIHIATKELEWISVKESIGPNKLKQKFLDNLSTEHIEVHAIKSNHSISTFRTMRASIATETISYLTDVIHAVHNKEMTVNEEENNVVSENAKTEEHGSEEKKTTENTARRSKVPQDTKSKREARKQLRNERAALFQELLASKPDESYEDPRDVAAIRFAETHMGDYKLKSGENYIVPESERVDADKKKRQMILLKESMRTLKEDFNGQILACRRRKEQVVDDIKQLNARIQEINQELVQMGEHVTDDIWEPVIEEVAYPERRYIITETDVQDYTREEHQKLLRAHGSNNELNFTKPAENNQEQMLQPPPEINAPPSHNSTVGTQSNISETPGITISSATLSSMGESAPIQQRPAASHKREMSKLEQDERATKLSHLLRNKAKLQKDIQNLVSQFDESVKAIERDRVLLEADLKACDMRLLLLYREWVLLKEFEINDNSLADKLKQKKLEKKDIVAKLLDCQDKLQGKKLEIENVIKRGKEIHEEFVKALGENNKNEEILTKIFKKKVKRSKKKAKAANAENADEKENTDSESDSDDSMSDDDFDYDSEELSEEENANDVDDSLPKDCDPALHALVLELRERRLDQEDILVDIQKNIELLKKDHDALLKKEKIIDSGLAATEKEIQEFQTQKQQKLNELDMVVPLRLHQLQWLDTQTGALPVDLSPALIFTQEGLQQLKDRIRELQQEKADIRKQHKELRKMHVNLVKSKKEKQAKLMELEARAYDVQMLKFGHVIDLEKLERMGVNKAADDLREKLARDEIQRQHALAAHDSQIERLKDTLTRVTREHTARLERLVQLTESQQRLEAALNATQTALTAEYRGLQKRDVAEMDRLKNIARAQFEEIEAMKLEISSLVSKGRLEHALPPTV